MCHAPDLSGPGLVFFIPCIDKWKKVDMRVITSNIPRQAMMTQDAVTVTLNAVVFYRVDDAESAITRVEKFKFAITELAQKPH